MAAQTTILPAMTLPSHLTFFSDDNPGYSRKKWGSGFRYFDEKGKPLTNKNCLERINALVIPPAWSDVWISPKANGHLQCTGTDQKERKQYIYHEDWTSYRQKQKFSNLRAFGKCLRHIRKSYHAELRRRGWPKTKVLAPDPLSAR